MERFAIEEHATVRFAVEKGHVDRGLLVPPVPAIDARKSAVVTNSCPLIVADHNRTTRRFATRRRPVEERTIRGTAIRISILVVDPKTIRVGGYADAAKGVSIRDCDALTIGRKRRSEGIAFGPFRYANTHVAADAVQVILHYFIRSQNRITLTSTSATTRGFFPADMNDLHQSARQTVCNKFQQLWHSLADASANKSIPVSPTRQRGSGAIQTLLLTLALFKLKNLARRPHVCA